MNHQGDDKEENVMVWGWTKWTACDTGVAAPKLLLPDWLAVMVTVPEFRTV